MDPVSLPLQRNIFSSLGDSQRQPSKKAIKKDSRDLNLAASSPASVRNSRFIPEEIKQYFLQLITSKNYSMKNAANQLNLSYSTAKKIYAKFRKAIRPKAPQQEQCGCARASFKFIDEELFKPVMIITSFAGQINEDEKMCESRGLEHKSKETITN